MTMPRTKKNPVPSTAKKTGTGPTSEAPQDPVPISLPPRTMADLGLPAGSRRGCFDPVTPPLDRLDETVAAALGCELDVAIYLTSAAVLALVESLTVDEVVRLAQPGQLARCVEGGRVGLLTAPDVISPHRDIDEAFSALMVDFVRRDARRPRMAGKGA